MNEFGFSLFVVRTVFTVGVLNNSCRGSIKFAVEFTVVALPLIEILGLGRVGSSNPRRSGGVSTLFIATGVGMDGTVTFGTGRSVPDCLTEIFVEVGAGNPLSFGMLLLVDFSFCPTSDTASFRRLFDSDSIN